MARSQEKAQSMLYRFREQQATELGISAFVGDRRPREIDSVKSVQACEKWRGQVVKEIARKINRIHDSSVSQYQIRDLNDSINELMREKSAWEHRLRALDGPDYLKGSNIITDEYGREIKSNKGYKYFGRAQELADVQEMIVAQRKAKAEPEKDTLQGITAAYFFGSDDRQLLAFEERLEAEAAVVHAADSRIDTIPSVNIPSQQEIEDMLIQRRKARLLNKLEDV